MLNRHSQTSSGLDTAATNATADGRIVHNQPQSKGLMEQSQVVGCSLLRAYAAGKQGNMAGAEP